MKVQNSIQSNDVVPIIGRRALVVGMQSHAVPCHHPVFERAQCVQIAFTALSRTLRNGPEAQLVVAPLMAQKFDAMDVAVALKKAQFLGSLVVIAPDLPNPLMVLREITRDWRPEFKCAILAGERLFSAT